MVLLVLSIAKPGTAQVFSNELVDSECASAQIMELLRQQDPDYQERAARAEALIYEQSLEQAQLTERNSMEELYTIPVVVHIIHETGTPIGQSENLSDFAVKRIIEEVNKDFRHQSNAGFSNPFMGVDTKIEFCLAKRTPEGLPTNGIDRHADDELTIAPPNFELTQKYNWNTYQYYNIYIVKNLNGALGYAYLAASHGTYYDGAVLQYNAGPSSWTHELGHALNLYHIYADEFECPSNDNCLIQGDRICDTPPQATTGCMLGNSCRNDEADESMLNPYRSRDLGGLGETNDLKQNYMNSLNFSCRSAFTLGQKNRMRIAVQGLRKSYIHSDVCTPMDALIDLDLTLTSTDANPGVGEYVAITAKVRNQGATTAHNITVDFLNYSSELIYSQEFDPIVSTGEFVKLYPHRSQWHIPELNVGETATVSIVYFTKSDNITYYSQIVAHDEEDIDSTPNNNYCCTPKEDDEATLRINDIEGLLADLSLNNLTNIPITIPSNQLITYNYDLQNSGGSAVVNSYALEVYLSRDIVFSTSDIRLGKMTINYTPVGVSEGLQGAFTTPVPVEGAYYLILVVDAQNEIKESNEFNNILVSPKTITIIPTLTDDPPIFYLDETEGLHLSPNPASTELKLDFYSDMEDMIPVNIYNLMGHLHLTERFHVYKGQQEFQINIERLEQGVYFLHLGEKGVYRFIKQ